VVSRLSAALGEHSHCGFWRPDGTMHGVTGRAPPLRYPAGDGLRRVLLLSPADTVLGKLENAAGLPARPGGGLHRRGHAGQPHVRGARGVDLRPSPGVDAHLLSEVVATAGFLLVIFALTRTGRERTAPAAVGAFIGAAYFFTSSTSFTPGSIRDQPG
jgi:hypothetical protein